MYKIYLFLAILLVLFGPSLLCAQVDTTLLIKEIKITESSIRNQNVGGKKDVIYKGKNVPGLDLTSLLNLEGGVYIKSYGANSLGTSSIRGGSAGHTLLLWNGVPLQSPTLGLLDLSLIPVQLMDNISIQRGGNSALWGSGAIGGVINLENKIGSKTYIGGNFRFGSFGNLSAGIELGYGQKGYYGKTKISHTQSENNFNYRVADQAPLIEQINAGFNTLNINQDLYFTINEKQFVNIHYWWQSSTKEIPATLTQNNNESYQEDEANRLIVNWTRNSNNNKTHIKIAILDEDQLYVDPLIRLSSNNLFTQWFAEAGHTIKLKNKQQLSLGITVVETTAKTNGFSNRISETKMGLWLSHQLELGKMQIQSSIREEWVEGAIIPLIPSIGLEYPLSETFRLRSKFSRNYRLATLNDKFWKPGGNTELLPESGWSQEFGFQIKKSKNNHLANFEVTGFNRTIENWIQWAPSSEFNFWSAQNLTEVWSRGIETGASYKYKSKLSSVGFKLNYNYVKSTNEVALILPKRDKGQQLIYTPLHQVSAQLAFTYKNTMLTYQHLYTGKNQGVNEDIPAYNLGNVMASHLMNYKKSDIKLFLQVQNIWNARYVVIERRPMPGINFQLGINFIINRQ